MSALLLGQNPTLDPEALPEDSTADLYARAAIAMKNRDEQGVMALAKNARTTGSNNIPRFEADLRLLGFKEQLESGFTRTLKLSNFCISMGESCQS